MIGSPFAGDATRYWSTSSMNAPPSCASNVKRHVNSHLVTIEIGVIMQYTPMGVRLNGFTFNQHWLKRLDTQGGASVGARLRSTGCSRITLRPKYPKPLATSLSQPFS